MIDITWILIIIILFLAIMLFATMERVDNLERVVGISDIEGFDASAGDIEAVGNVASLYNQANFTVTNLKVTGDLEVAGNLDVGGKTKLNSTKMGPAEMDSANIGKWNIRNDRIGIQNLADLHLANDKWVRLTDPDKDTYAGTDGQSGGFAGSNLWCANGTAWSKRNIVDGVTLDKNPAFGGIFRITAPLEVDQAMNTGINWDRPGIMAKNIIVPSRDFVWGPPWWQGPSHQTAVNVAKKMPEGSLVIGPAIGNNNNQVNDWDHIVSAAKKISKNNCDVRGMYWALTNHGNPLACN